MNANLAPSIIRINGKQLTYSSDVKIPQISEIKEALAEGAKEGMKILVNPLTKSKNMFVISIWNAAGVMLSQMTVSAQTVGASSSPSMWKEIEPVFGVFQEISMIVGALAIIAGLIIMVFKKKLGWTIISTAGLVVLGCFLVPSAVMLVAIIGKLLNGALTHAFEAFSQG